MVSASLTKILFIGNSFTIRNKMVETFKSFDPSALSVSICARGSASWASHARESHHCIVDDEWDFVVLQEQSMMLTLPQKEVASIRHAESLAESIRRNNNATTILLFETWAYEYGGGYFYDTPGKMQAKLFEGYMEVGERIDALPTLIGEAVLFASPRLPMWDWDGRHPSKYTSYLTAVMFYLKIHQGLHRPMPCNFKKRSDCEFLQNVARMFVAIA